MADHHHQHRPLRLSVPQRAVAFDSSPSTPSAGATGSSPPPYSNSSPSPTPTPSKQRLHPLRIPSKSSPSSSKSSLSFLLITLFSLRSLYSLIPPLRSSPFSSLFPFCFLVSFLSFLCSLCFSMISPPSPKTPSHFRSLKQPIFSISSVSLSQHKLLLFKSLLLAVALLFRFQALRYCSTAVVILAEFSGNVAVRFVSEARKRNVSRIDNGNYFLGFFALFSGLLLLSLSWDRIDCFPLSSSFIDTNGFSLVRSLRCLRIWPLILLFLSGFISSFERVQLNPVAMRQLGHNTVRLMSLFYATLLLLIPAIVSFIMLETDSGVSIGNFGWPLVNIVVFGVLLNQKYGENNLVYSKDFQREFEVTFACTVVLELFYFPEMSLWGLSLSGLLLYFSVRNLDTFCSSYVELGLESPEPLSNSIMKPIRHILSERKSRKIALFLLINTAYMVVEFIAAFMSNSLGLISDACHMLFDCAALAIGLYASYISRLPANSQFNYGRGRFEVLSGYVNAVFLVLVGALIVLESFERILDPQEISTNSLLTVSIGGLLVNVIGLIFFHEEHHHAHGGCSHSHDHDGHQKHHECISMSHDRHQKASSIHSDHHNHDHDHDHTHHHDHDHSHRHDHDHDHSHHHDHDHTHHDNQDHHHIDHNMEGIFLHVLADTLGSVGVVVSTLLIKYKGWLVADPACSIFISVLIVSSVISLLRNSAEILLLRVPRSQEQDLREAVNAVEKIQEVHSIQSLHVWSLTNSDIVGTLHFYVKEEIDEASTKAQVVHIFNDVGIKDLTVQIECAK